jgi:hypothetical protein
MSRGIPSFPRDHKTVCPQSVGKTCLQEECTIIAKKYLRSQRGRLYPNLSKLENPEARPPFEQIEGGGNPKIQTWRF